MNLESLWVKDPKSGEPSVSLTLVVLSGGLLMVSMALEMTSVIRTTSLSFEFFGAACGLYWGRRWTSAKGQSIASDKE